MLQYIVTPLFALEDALLAINRYNWRCDIIDQRSSSSTIHKTYYSCTAPFFNIFFPRYPASEIRQCDPRANSAPICWAGRRRSFDDAQLNAAANFRSFRKNICLLYTYFVYRTAVHYATLYSCTGTLSKHLPVL